MIGRTVSHYRIESQLGAGGMGVVYRAEDDRLGRSVALKFLHEDLAHEPDAIRRLRAEARAASALNHASICTIYDIGEVDGHPFIVMELLKGRSLRECLADGPLEIGQLVDIGIEVADALHVAHAGGVIHRDITPGNVFLTDRGRVKILDFGLAKLAPVSTDPETTIDTAHRTAEGITLGTVAYMSPEQAMGEELDGRTDLFSLGVVLYECATGQHPFPGKRSPVILAAILNRTPAAPASLNPDLPPHLGDVITACLEKDRDRRYQSAGDLRADLKRVRRDLESDGTHAVTVMMPAARQAARRLAPTTATAAVTAQRDDAAPARHARWTALTIAGAVLAIALVSIGAYAIRVGGVRQDTSPNQATAAQAVENRVALAASSLEAKNYRAAAAYAAEALALEPGQPAASRIHEQAVKTLGQFDAAIAEARRLAAAGDIPGSTRALETAKAIDAGSPLVADVVSRLAERVPAAAPTAPAAPPRPAAEARRLPGRLTALPAPADTAAASPPPPASAPVAAPGASQAQVPTTAPDPLPQPPPRAATSTPTEPPAAPQVPALPPAAADAEPREREDDDAAIRRVTASYARAIEIKDLALFKSIKPNLSREEERRLQDGFRAVSSQRVALTITSIDRRGDEASVRVKRRDTIEAGGRTQTVDSDQTLQLTRTSAGWVVVAIR